LTAPDIIVKLRDGGFISVLKSKAEVLPRELPEGTHRPDGIFIGYGPSFKEGIELEGSLPITCVTPLMLALGDMEIPGGLTSDVPYQVLAEEAERAKIVRINDKIDAMAAEVSDDHDQSHMDKDVLMEQLKTLGYVD